MIKQLINKVMAKLSSKKDSVEKNEISETNSNPVKELSFNEKKNIILKYLEGKNPGEYTSEEKIERSIINEINYYDTRQILPFLVNEGHLEYTTFQCSYKLTFSGREFLSKGGYPE